MSPEFPLFCLCVIVGWFLSITNLTFPNLTNGSNGTCPTAPRCTGLQSKEGVGWESGQALARPSLHLAGHLSAAVSRSPVLQLCSTFS